LEEKKGSIWVGKSGVLKNERGGDGDTLREETIDDGKSVKLVCL
jgi:hypothetical protein